MTSKKPRYLMLVEWSEEDQSYLVTLPEWEGRLLNWRAATHGDTYEEAIRDGHEVLETLMEIACERGESLPEPRVFAGV